MSFPLDPFLDSSQTYDDVRSPSTHDTELAAGYLMDQSNNWWTIWCTIPFPLWSQSLMSCVIRKKDPNDHPDIATSLKLKELYIVIKENTIKL